MLEKYPVSQKPLYMNNNDDDDDDDDNISAIIIGLHV